MQDELCRLWTTSWTQQEFPGPRAQFRAHTLAVADIDLCPASWLSSNLNSIPDSTKDPAQSNDASNTRGRMSMITFGTLKLRRHKWWGREYSALPRYVLQARPQTTDGIGTQNTLLWFQELKKWRKILLQALKIVCGEGQRIKFKYRYRQDSDSWDSKNRKGNSVYNGPIESCDNSWAGKSLAYYKTYQQSWAGTGNFRGIIVLEMLTNVEWRVATRFSIWKSKGM